MYTLQFVMNMFKNIESLPSQNYRTLKILAKTALFLANYAHCSTENPSNYAKMYSLYKRADRFLTFFQKSPKKLFQNIKCYTLLTSKKFIAEFKFKNENEKKKKNSTKTSKSLKAFFCAVFRDQLIQFLIFLKFFFEFKFSITFPNKTMRNIIFFQGGGVGSDFFDMKQSDLNRMDDSEIDF